MVDSREALERLAVRDDRFITSILCADDDPPEVPDLDEKTRALVRLGALFALNATMPSHVAAVQDALAAGCSSDDIVGALLAVVPSTGVVRASAAAPKVALALGYELDDALEGLDVEPSDSCN